MESPFAPYLCTNYAPSDEEIHKIRELLPGPQRKLEEIEGKIAELRRQIKHLEEEQDELGQYTKNHTALLNPIRRLPVDIFRAIFLSCALNEQDHFSNTYSVSAGSAPMVLTFVCRSWRQIALDYSALWHKLGFFINGSFMRGHWTGSNGWSGLLRGRAELFRLWISRCANREVTISVSLRPHDGVYPKNDGDAMEAFMDCILESSFKWKSFWIRSPLAFANKILAIPSSSAPNMQHLYVETLEDIPVDVKVAFGTGQQLISGISSLQYHYIHMTDTHHGPDVPFMDMPIRWGHLVDISLGDAPMWDTELLQLLSRCPQLKKCDIWEVRCRMLGPLPKVVVSANLLSLSIQELKKEGSSIHLFSSMELPVLSTLALTSADEDLGSLTPIIERFSAGIRDLSVNAPLITSQDALKLLVKTPMLEALAFLSTHHGHVQLSNDFLVALTPSSGNPAFPVTSDGEHALVSRDRICPRLQAFTIEHTLNPVFSSDAIYNFIQARRDLASTDYPLTFTIIHNCSSDSGCPTHHGLGIVERLKNSGVDVTFRQYAYYCTLRVR